jgi:peptidoglycan/LPS O-acetylase OafA/YrhL
MSKPAEHVPEIDWLKGFAILSVVCIHAQLYSDSFFFLTVINRAVHIFLFLFGVASELWWQRESARAPDGVVRHWYTGRLGRILPGYWAIIAIWWLIVVLWREPPNGLRMGGVQALVSFAGYAPWFGTTWFVTLVLQYILIFPALRWVTVRLGAMPSLCIAAAATVATCWFILQVIDTSSAMLGKNVPAPGWYYYWIFVPRVLWDVTAGIFVARWWRGRISVTAMLIGLALTALGAFLGYLARKTAGDFFSGNLRELVISHIVDVPLSIALLGLLRWTPLPRRVRSFLGWCGLWSWGIYLGHILLHDVAQIAGFGFYAAQQWVRAIYALGLFGGGAALAVTADWLERQIRQRVTRSEVSTPA